MNPMDAIAFFNATHVVVMHASSTKLKAYAYWIEDRFIEADDYVGLAVKVKAIHDAGVAAGKLPALPPARMPYAGAEGMDCKWPTKPQVAPPAPEGSSKTAQFKAAL